jgi:hypothetical protein
MIGWPVALDPAQRNAIDPMKVEEHQATAESCVQFAPSSDALLAVRQSMQLSLAPGSFVALQAASRAAPH